MRTAHHGINRKKHRNYEYYPGNYSFHWGKPFVKLLGIVNVNKSINS